MKIRYLTTSTEVLFLASLLASVVQGGNWQEFAVWPTSDEQEAPDIWGDIIVWQQFVAEYGDYDIYIVDINNPDEPSIFVIGDSNDQTSPAVYENMVVWQDYRNNNWDIFGYNLTTQKEFQITDDSADQTNPAINGNMVVWQDNRNGNSEIYAVVLNGPVVARCASRTVGDVNGDCKIDFADFAIMASRWLECYLEPAEACW